MNKILRLAVVAFFVASASTSAAQVITAEHEAKAKEIVNRMTLEEKIKFLSGRTSFSLQSFPHLDIPQILLADGPQGIRNHAPHSTLYPAGILTAATWNRTLARRFGQSLGKDARARGVSILLGPGVNIYRSPLCGRNYEYFGEDPLLTGETAKEYIIGVQEQGVVATIKHFCVNNQEWSRHHVSSDVDERTLNEIYFPAFRKAVQEANVGAVMDSYNLVNGVHSTENAYLNIEVLRNQWGFKGILMSDWTSVYSTIGAANNGLDLEMPKGKYLNAERLLPAIKNGTVTESTIDKKVCHILQTLMAFGALDSVRRAGMYPLDNPESRQTALDVAREGIVLLKNSNGVLPLRGRTAILGPNADVITTGGGSGHVEPFSSISASEALKKVRRNTILLTDDVIYDDITPQLFTDSTLSTVGLSGEYFKNQKLQGEPDMTRTDSKVDFDWGSKAPADGFPADHFSARWTAFYHATDNEDIKLSIGGDDGYRVLIDGKVVAGDWGNHSYSSREVNFTAERGKTYKLRIDFFDNISDAKVSFSMKRLNKTLLAKGLSKADNIVYCTGFNSNTEGEGFDRPFALPAWQNTMIGNMAATGKKTVVVLNAGGGVDMSQWIDNVDAVLMAWYPGQEGGTAIADILTGKISPSGKLPISIERRWEDNPSHDNYYANAPQKEVKTVEYREGVFVGYRGYDRQEKKPLFPFGFGLSYSSFKYSDLNVSKDANGGAVVAFNVTNTGFMDAKEVAQVYVHDCESSVPRPLKELKGYEKLSLRKGETKRVEIKLSSEAFAFYDTMQHKFIVEPGAFDILVGSSSADLPLKGTVQF